MGDIIPYFYYDIIARMIPGAATLYVLAATPIRFSSPISGLLTGTENWKGVVTMLALAGAAYTIGVFYESLFFLPLFSKYKIYFQQKAMIHAIRKYEWNDSALKMKAESCPKNFCTSAWENLVVLGGKEPEMKPLFAHCHRFQAEAKLCQHLLVPTLLYVVVFISGNTQYWCRSVAAGLTALIFLVFASFWRDERRWWQVLSFGEREGFLPDAAQKIVLPNSGESVTTD